MPPVSAVAPSKEALCIVIDVSHGMTTSNLEAVKLAGSDFIVQKMLYSPSDEVGLIFAGTSGTKNRLNATSPSNFKNITVMRPVMKPTGDYIADIGHASVEGGTMDMFEAILCAADLITESTQDKKYKRRIMLMSAVIDPVKNKKALTEVQQGLAARDISLVVTGVDFTVTDDQDWGSLTTTKQQNERVISIICQQLGDSSFVFPVEDAILALSSLRKRNVSERTSSRAVLTIGDIKIAVYIYTKTLQARVPTLKKASSTSAEASNVQIDRRYFIASTMEEVATTERVKVLKYGRSVVPCASFDEEQMKFVSDRGLDCLGFINTSDIPPHILTGGCKAVGPAMGDGEGATALAAFVQGMVHTGSAMLVRFVRCANASPVVCVCFPSAKAERHILYMVPLPYAEDFRRYLLPDFGNILLNASEAKCIDDMVTAMTLTDDDGVKTNRVYNPSLQQYYSWVRARYLQTREKMAEVGNVGGGVTPAPPSAHKAIGTPLPGMPEAVKYGATCWGEQGNVLFDKLKSSRPLRESVAKAFPFTPPTAPNAPGAEGKAYWFGHGNGVGGSVLSANANIGLTSSGEPPTSKGPRTEASTGGHGYYAAAGISSDPAGHSAVVTSASSPWGSSSADHYLSTGSTQGTTAASSAGGTVSGVGTSAAQGIMSAAPSNTRAITAINTANPVESFLAMVNNKAMDLVDEAVFRMGELVLTLLKLSIGNQFFLKCEHCVRALRRVCVDEDEPAAYFAFLQRLMLMTRGGAHDAFWSQHIVLNGLGPITCEESPASVITPTEAARFMTEGIKAPAPPILDDEGAGDELLDLLE